VFHSEPCSEMPTLIEAVTSYRNQLRDAIVARGTAGKTAAIRSGKPIQAIHEAVKIALRDKGVGDSRFSPSVDSSKGELTLTGFIKKKRQDVCVKPHGLTPSKRDRLSSLLSGTEDSFGAAFTERTIAINVRSQFSSLAKNFDTLFERTVAEAHNLHLNCPSMVLGEVYMIAAPEYDVGAIEEHQFKPLKTCSIEKYVEAFAAINNRKSASDPGYMYERVCLLVVDFSEEVPVIHQSTDALREAGLLKANSTVKYEGLGWDTFAQDILGVYVERFE